MTPESALVRSIRLAVGQQAGIVIWRNSTGIAVFRSSGYREQTVRYGLCPGSADIIGLVAPHGRFLALEVKTPKGRLTKEQQCFLDLINRLGGVGRMVRSVNEAMAVLEEARRPAALTTGLAAMAGSEEQRAGVYPGVKKKPQ